MRSIWCDWLRGKDLLPCMVCSQRQLFWPQSPPGSHWFQSHRSSPGPSRWSIYWRASHPCGWPSAQTASNAVPSLPVQVKTNKTWLQTGWIVSLGNNNVNDILLMGILYQLYLIKHNDFLETSISCRFYLSLGDKFKFRSQEIQNYQQKGLSKWLEEPLHRW